MNILDRLDELEKAATPGPWMAGSYYDDTAKNNLRFNISQDPGDRLLAERLDEADAALIAEARNHLRALIEIARAAEKARAWPTPVSGLDELRAALSLLEEGEV